MKKNVIFLLANFCLACSFLQGSIEVLQEACYPPLEKLESSLKENLDAIFIYHTVGIYWEARVAFLQAYAINQTNAHSIQDAYTEMLKVKALDKIFNDINILAKKNNLENQFWFWDTVHYHLINRFSSSKISDGARQKFEAFIKLKKNSI